MFQGNQQAMSTFSSDGNANNSFSMFNGILKKINRIKQEKYHYLYNYENVSISR